MMIDTGVVISDGAGLVLYAARAHSEHGVGLVTRSNFVYDTITNILFVKYYVLASITLLYFDHAITLPLEVRRVWCSRFTGASFLFLLNRYLPAFGYIPIILGLFNPPWDINQCRRFAPFIGALTLVSNVIAAIILILRTYALYSRALWVLLVTGFLGAVSVAIGAWSASSVEGELFTFQPIVVCVPMLTHESGLKFAWITTFIFDIVVFLLTITRTYRFMKAHARVHMHSDLAALLMRDGSIYFLVMSIVNAVNYILSARIRNSFFASATGTNSILSNVISVTMISRLLLNLREESFQSSRRSTSGTRMSTRTDTNLVFTSRVFGNLTAELDYGSPWNSSAGEASRGYSSHSCEYSGEDSEEVYELQSRGRRSRLTERSVYTATDPGSSSGSGTDSAKGKSKAGRLEHPKLAWSASVNTMASSSSVGRHWADEPQTPATAVDELTVGLLPSGECSPQLLSPLSPATLHSSSPTLLQPSPLSSHPHSPLSRGHVKGNKDMNERKDEDLVSDWERADERVKTAKER